MRKKATGKKAKKDSVLRVCNPKGVLTRREICRYVGVTRGYLSMEVKRGNLVSDVKSYFGMEEFYSKQNVDKWRKAKRVYVSKK